MIEVTVKETEPVTTAFIRKRGSYDQIPMAMGALYNWVGEHGLTPAGMPSGVYLTAPDATAEQSAEWELRTPLAGDPVPCEPDGTGCGVARVPSHLVASTMYRGPYDSIAPTYIELSEWVGSHGYHVAGPPEELYYSDPDTTPPDEYLTEVRLHVAR
jgi:effector-binding domain-containing protein